MNINVYKKLREIAIAGKLIYYDEVAQIAGLDFDNLNDRLQELPALLGEVSEFEHSVGAPLLSVVAIGKTEKMPGAGFFKMARDLGLYSKNDDDKNIFSKELKKVYAYWQ